MHYQLSNGEKDSMNFESAYDIKEATPKQIEAFREKESKLAQR